VSAEQKSRGSQSQTPTPPCETTDDANYTVETVTGGLLAFHDPCGYADCYPGDECPGWARGSSGLAGARNKLHRSPQERGVTPAPGWVADGGLVAAEEIGIDRGNGKYSERGATLHLGDDDPDAVDYERTPGECGDSVAVTLILTANSYVSGLVLDSGRESVTSNGRFRADWAGRYRDASRHWTRRR
jgi:hypothetical protein